MPLTDHEYIEALENSLIFMCQCHEDVEKQVLNELMKQRNELWMQWPRIQGTVNLMGIARLSKLPFNHSPKYGFRDIFDEYKRRNAEVKEGDGC